MPLSELTRGRRASDSHGWGGCPKTQCSELLVAPFLAGGVVVVSDAGLVFYVLLAPLHAVGRTETGALSAFTVSPSELAVGLRETMGPLPQRG